MRYKQYLLNKAYNLLPSKMCIYCLPSIKFIIWFSSTTNICTFDL